MIDESRIKDDRVLFSNADMAKMCGVTPKTWCVWVKKGFAPYPVRVGGANKWLKDDIVTWCRELKLKAARGE